MKRIYDKHGQLVREFPDDQIRGMYYIMPIRLPMIARASDFKYPEVWRHEGGRVEFERLGVVDGAEERTEVWTERRRKYEEWYHNPWTGETWGRRRLEPEGFQDTRLDWSYA